MAGIFINYRGDDSQTAAALIDRELTARFGTDQVFLDSRSIRAGTDFVDELLGRLRTCSVLLVVIGPRWLTLTDEAGQRRIDDPQDWIRREIVEAFSHGMRIIPVLLDGVKLPTAADLPDDIAGLSRRQYVPMRRRYTGVDLTFLVKRITEKDPESAKVAARRRLIVAGLASAVVFTALFILILVVSAGDSDTADKSDSPGTRQTETAPGATPAPLTSIQVPQGTEIPLDLVAGAADYQVPPRWQLRGDAVESGRCGFQLFGPAGYRRYVNGATPLVHGRQAGTYQVRSAENCRIYIRGDDEYFVTLPYVLEGTGQSSASPVFEVDSGFTVAMGPGEKCGAAVFRDHDGGKEGQSVGADSIRSFRGPGRFWVETETYDCRLEILGG